MQDKTQLAQQAQRFVSYEVMDAEGRKVGTVASVWVDGATGQPEFVAVNSATNQGGTSILPLAGTNPNETSRQLRVPYSADQIMGAPQFEATANLSEQDEQRIYQHYGVRRSEAPSPTGLAAGQASGRQKTEQHQMTDQHGMTDRQRTTGQGQQADADMTHRHDQDDSRSTRGQVEHGGEDHTLELREERLRVEKEREQAGEVRLGKRVTEQTEQVEVPLREERVVIERHPGTGRAVDGEIGDTDREIDVPVMKERATVEKETVVTEEVGVRKEATERTEPVRETLRREELVVDGDGDLKTEGENLNAPRAETYEREQSRRTP